MDEKTPRITRRDFVRGTSSLLGGMAAASLAGGARLPAAPPEEARLPLAVLGRTGARVSRLGVGCAPFGHKEVSVEDVRKVLLRALELGVNYLDTAPNYGDAERGFSEEKMGPTIKEVRDRVFLVSKSEEPTYEGTWKVLRQSLKRLQTDRLDLVHLHNFGNEERFGDLELVLGEKGALGALREAKKQGVIRFIGASGHLHPSRFHAVLDTGEIDVLMNAVNFVVRHTYDFEHKVWSRARRQGLGLVAMKVLGGSGPKGFRMPAERYEEALRYALSVEGVTLAVVGVKDVAELERAARTVAAFRPLSPEEAHALAKQGLELSGTPEWKAAYGEPLT
ncbi:MAG: aldo/keto reductase [Planctomycetes bacterium]|nr:aldo/keto reductase [Planctomycetota bacterium]